MKGAWIIWYEDADMKPVLFSGEGAEQAARRAFERALNNWNCHLFRTIELNPELAAE